MLRDTLKTLLAAYGPSGNEHTVAETVKGLIASCGQHARGCDGQPDR